MPDQNLQKLTRKNLLHTIRAAVGSSMFRHLYVRNNTTGQELDVAGDGSLSCAIMTSSILALQALIDRPHATVGTTLAKMQEAGWYKIEKPQASAVVQWPAESGHEHIGFVLDQKTCVSHSDKQRTPVEHPFKMPDGRQPIAFYWHKELDNEA